MSTMSARHSPLSPCLDKDPARTKRASSSEEGTASYGDYVRAVAIAMGTPKSTPAGSPVAMPQLTPKTTPALAHSARPSPVRKNSGSVKGTSVVSPAIMAGAPSPIISVTCAFPPSLCVGEALPDACYELEGFQLDTELDEAFEGKCRACNVKQVWVVVNCFHEGEPACHCKEHPSWALCEACCETLLHDKCLTDQCGDRPQLCGSLLRGLPAVEEEDDVPPSPGATEKSGMSCPSGKAEQFYDTLLSETPEDAAWNNNQWCEYNPYANGHPTVNDLKFMGANLNHICITFAATGCCPRGNSCWWIHCAVMDPLELK